VRVEVAIDELVLRGDFSPSQARAVAAALEARLTALAEKHEGPVHGRAESSRRLEPVRAERNELGGAVAEAVWEAIA
jgi:hypothetical protein